MDDYGVWFVGGGNVFCGEEDVVWDLGVVYVGRVEGFVFV